MSNASRLLITGATGLLGWALVREGIGRYEVVGLARHLSGVNLPCRTISVDLVDEAAVARAVEACDPDVIIHSAALTSVDQCQKDPIKAKTLNVDATKHLLKAIRGRACRVIFISTDAVFDGVKGAYRETDPTGPLNIYGQTKLQAEEIVLAECTDALVLRTTFYGWNLLPKESLGEWILHRLRASQVVPGFQDMRFSPLLSDQLARMLYDLISIRVTGILHLASGDSCSKYEFAQRLARIFGFPVDWIVPTTRQAAHLSAPRPADGTLAVERVQGILGRRLPSIEDGLREFLATEAAVAHSVQTELSAGGAAS